MERHDSFVQGIKDEMHRREKLNAAPPPKPPAKKKKKKKAEPESED